MSKWDRSSAELCYAYQKDSPKPLLVWVFRSDDGEERRVYCEWDPENCLKPQISETEARFIAGEMYPAGTESTFPMNRRDWEILRGRRESGEGLSLPSTTPDPEECAWASATWEDP